MDDTRTESTPDDRAEHSRRVQADSERAVKRYALPLEEGGIDLAGGEVRGEELSPEAFQRTVLEELQQIRGMLTQILRERR